MMPAAGPVQDGEACHAGCRAIRTTDGLRVKRGPADDAGFQAFVGGHQGALFGFAMNLSGDRTLAEDLVADVLLRSYEKWDRIRVLEHPMAYVRRMLLNEFLKDRRLRTRARARRHLAVVSESTPDPAVQLTERSALMGRIATLPRQQRAALMLRYFLDLSDAEIAVEMGCAAGSVRSYVSRGLTTLRIEQGQPEADAARNVSDARTSEDLPQRNAFTDTAAGDHHILPRSGT